MQFRFSNETAEFIVFRFVPDGRDKRAQIKGDIGTSQSREGPQPFPFQQYVHSLQGEIPTDSTRSSRR